MRKILGFSALLCASHLFAHQFSFQVYNDYFAGTDKHFTNGVALSWLDTNGKKGGNSTTFYSDAMIWLVDSLPFTDINNFNNYTAGASISQIMITPKDTTLSTPQYNDIPYAGYLALSLFVFEWSDYDFKEYRLDLGVVGKESGAANLQKNFHEMIGNPIPQGWDTQLRHRDIANALFRYGNKTWESGRGDSLNADWFNHFGFQAGNYVTDVFFGSMFRFGNNYSQNFNVHYPYLREEASLLRIDGTPKGFGWSFSLGFNVEVLAYSYVLDGAKSEGYHTNKNIANASGYAGLDFYYNKHKLTLFYQGQSSYIDTQHEIDVYGGIMYNYQF